MKDQELNLTEARERQLVEVPCIKIDQPIGLFFSGRMTYQDVIDVTYSDVRRIENEERAIETYLGIQRPLSPKRVKDLQQYVNNVDACFPTAILLSVPERCAEYDEAGGILRLRPYVDEEAPERNVNLSAIAKVLDGQHRIAGLEGYSGKKRFDVNVSIFIDIDVASEAYVFSVVNQAQTKVSKSLVYDLYDLAMARSPQKICHNIAVTLNDTEGSPFNNKIKRLGSATQKTKPASITQAAFVESLMKMLSTNAMSDRDAYLRGRKPSKAKEGEQRKLIFRELMLEEKDFELTDIVWNYFSAVRERWPVAWGSEEDGIMLSRTNGFMALMRFLRDSYLAVGGGVPSQEDFFHIFGRIDLDNEDFNTDRFKPGTSGESALYRELLIKAQLA